ncbi:hypothetical protein BJY04DRAFT_226791 [Aspergillus karnatakaensis]|uniref:DUF3659 domain-containing protein n=1 Tax=Aspergillus karnatakaensis TaxID=1810916 RepID=UPI003CCD691D
MASLITAKPVPHPGSSAKDANLRSPRYGITREQRRLLHERQPYVGSASGSSNQSTSYLNAPRTPALPKLGKLTASGEEKSGTSARGPVKDISLSDLNGLHVGDGGNILNELGRPIGEVVEGDPADLLGQTVSRDGEILDEDGDLIGLVDILHPDTAEARLRMLDPSRQTIVVPEEAIEDDNEADDESPDGGMPDISALEGLTCNTLGNVVTPDGVAVGELIDGDLKRICRERFQLDAQGLFRDYRGRAIGTARPISADNAPPAPFAEQRCLLVAEDGWVQNEKSMRVGKLVKGDASRVVGSSVDEDGDILDQRGNVIGHAEPWDESEVVDLSLLQGLSPNKQGFVVSAQGPIAQVDTGDQAAAAGKPIDKDGKIRNDGGEVVGRVSLISENERQQLGQFGGLGDLVATASGFVEDIDGTIVGRIVEGDPRVVRGASVHGRGEIVDQDGEIKGLAERCEQPIEDFSALDGMTVNKLGNVVDEEGSIVGRVVAGAPKKLVGRRVDREGKIWSDASKLIGQAEPLAEKERGTSCTFSDLKSLTVGKDGMVLDHSRQVVRRLIDGKPEALEGQVVNGDGKLFDEAGRQIGQAERWIPEGLNFESPSNLSSDPTLSPDGRVTDQKHDDTQVAERMCEVVQRIQDSVGLLSVQITKHIENAAKAPKEGIDEDQVVDDLTPLIQEAGNVLEECNSALQAIDPDGDLAALISTRGASPRLALGYQLADLVRQLLQTVFDLMQKPKHLLAVIPHARGRVSRLWATLFDLVFRIVTAVGLLVFKVVGLYSRALDFFRLGGPLRSILIGLGVDKLLEHSGLDAVREALELKVAE